MTKILGQRIAGQILSLHLSNDSLLFNLIFVFLLGSCALTTTRPKIEMSLAQAAFMAAKEAKADSLSPTLFRKAEVYYFKAVSAYRRKYFSKAKELARLAQKYSEEAEYDAVKKQALEGTKD